MINSTCIEIPLTQGKVALIDAEDYDLVKDFKWCAAKHGLTYYAVVRGVYLHRLLTGAAKGVPVDHVNGDGLDNRRANLRLCSTSSNMRNRGKQRNNTSGYKGITWAAGKWKAQIKAPGCGRHIGLFDDKHDAAEAYNAAALLHHGEFAKLNIIDRNT